MKKTTLSRILLISVSILVLYQCQKNPIPFDLDDPDVFIDTLTVTAISGGTFFSPPLMGSTPAMYFGNEDGNESLFSLLRFRNLSLTNSIYTYNLLDEDASMDSLVFTFTALDSNLLVDHPDLINTRFELYYFPQGGDSVFDESESNYINLTEGDVANSVAIGQGHFVETDPDSGDVTYPYLSINVDDLDNVLDFIADTVDTQNRTFMLKNIDPLDYTIAIRSRESSEYPVLTAHYQVDEDTLQSTFYPLEDVTIVKPRAVAQEDRDYLSIGRASGLKSILQIDLSSIPMDSSTIVFKTAELFINSTSLDSLNDWEIIAAVLDTGVTVENYWEVDEDEYTIEDETMTGYFEDALLGAQIREYLQGYMTGSYDNFGLKLYMSSLSDPFKTIHLIINSDDESIRPYIKVAYVKL